LDFKSLFPEVLILGDFKSFAPEVLILVKFKFMRMSEIGGFWKILEVLIMGGLRGGGLVSADSGSVSGEDREVVFGVHEEY
jgi:hypothetical protein